MAEDQIPDLTDELDELDELENLPDIGEKLQSAIGALPRKSTPDTHPGPVPGDQRRRTWVPTFKPPALPKAV